jgi:hypothetical protein
MELIQTYPELAKYLSSEGGRLTIAEEGLEKLEETKEQEVNAAYRESLQGQITASEKKTTANITSLARNTEYVSAEKVAANVVGYMANPFYTLGTNISTGIINQDWNSSFENELDSESLTELLNFASETGNEDIFTSSTKLKEALESSGNATLE